MQIYIISSLYNLLKIDTVQSYEVFISISGRLLYILKEKNIVIKREFTDYLPHLNKWL